MLSRPRSRIALLLAPVVAVGVVLIMGVGPAVAAEPPVGLGTAASFAVLAGSTVTNTGPSVINGDLGVSPGTAVTGFPPGLVNGAIHAGNAIALSAQADLTTAYNDAAGRDPAASYNDLGGQTLTPGVYTGLLGLGLTGTLTLDAHGDSMAMFIFQSPSALMIASNSTVALINGANPCNIYWQIGGSAVLGTNSTFVGTVLAQTSISAQSGATVTGRLLARNGAVTLDTNAVTSPDCTTPEPTTTPASPSASSGSSTSVGSTSPAATGSETGAVVPPVTTRSATARDAAGNNNAGPAAQNSLAATGPSINAPLIVGLLAIALGCLMLLAAQRRRLPTRLH